MGTNLHDTNGEYVEALHYSLNGFEEKKKLKFRRKFGRDGHLKRALTSHIPYIASGLTKQSFCQSFCFLAAILFLKIL